jgi:multiple antibiotic resistance protein
MRRNGSRTTAGIAGACLLLLAGTAAAAPAVSEVATASLEATPFSVTKLFTFLFLTLGPLKVIAPFATMTRGRDTRFKRRLALRGTVYATVGVVATATIGVSALRKWGLSIGALQFVASLLLFWVALKQVLEQYAARPAPAAAPEPAPASPPTVSALAFPLAFPTIATPYGVALLIMVLTLSSGTELVWTVLGVTAVVLALDFLAMLIADRIMKRSAVATALAIVGMVMGVLMMALGVQAGIDSLRMMDVI